MNKCFAIKVVTASEKNQLICTDFLIEAESRMKIEIVPSIQAISTHKKRVQRLHFILLVCIL